MKKLCSLLIVLATLCSVGCATLTASAFFGTGVAVIANDVKMIKTGLLGKKICFTDGDFKSALCLNDFNSITVSELPSSTEGTLLIGGKRVGCGRVIKRKNLGALVFIPASPSVTECSFKFTVEGYAGGAEIECLLKFIDKVNYAPEVAGSSTAASTVYTQAEISVFGNLEGSDPEGDEIEFIIVTYPKRGVLSLIDEESGRYCYTPNDDFTGSDKFTYVVRDEYGNYSTPCSVNIKITERMCDTVYRDMEYREEYNAAVAMTAMGVMGGKMLGDDMYFEPDEKVSRAEFVAMAMKCVGIRPDSTLLSTYFDDDADISVSLKGYIATAQRIGLVSGDFKDGKLVFAPNENITRYEAAKILSGIIGTDGEGEESVFATDSSIPIWARAGVYAMCSLGVFSESDESSLTECVSRADVAYYLYKMSKLK